ncbi:DUF58 domain-containing protein [Blastococcus sp. SYSU D00868]
MARAWAAVRAWTAPVAGRLRGGWLRPAGWGVLLLAAVAGGAGLALGWSELVSLGLAALVAVAGAALFALGRNTYRVTLEVPVDRVVVGEPAAARLEVANSGTRPVLPARLEVPVGRGLTGFALPRLAAGAAHDALLDVPTARRGVVVVGPVRSVRGDPFGLVGRTLAWGEPHPVFVHPRTVRLDASATGFLRDLEGQPTSVVSTNDISFHALREYVPGDDRRYVHWKSTARTGTIMVRQFEDTRRNHLAIALDDLAAGYTDEADFELAVSVCGSLGVQALRMEQDLTLATAQTLPTGTTTRLLDSLSALELRREGRDFAAVTEGMSRSARSVSTVALVTGSATPTEVVRRAAERFAPDVRVLAVRVGSGAEAAHRAVGRLRMLTLGSLDDLPRLLRRAAVA